MAAKAPKKASAPKKPVKPSSRSKTGNSACSQAASNWQLSIRGKEPLDPQTYATLAKCRAMNRTAKQADDRARMGYNLSDQGAAALKGRLQQRFDQGLITQKSRQERLKTLLAQRKEKQAGKAVEASGREDYFNGDLVRTTGATKVMHGSNFEEFTYQEGHRKGQQGWRPTKQQEQINTANKKAEWHDMQAGFARLANKQGAAAKQEKLAQELRSSAKQAGATAAQQKPAASPAPLSRAAALVQSVRSKPGYGVARASAAGNRELVGLRMKEKNKPATPPKFSRGGQLAPGRGTKDRSQYAKQLLSLPKEVRRTIVVEKRAERYSRDYGSKTEMRSTLNHFAEGRTILFGNLGKRKFPEDKKTLLMAGMVRMANDLRSMIKPATPPKFSRGGQLAPGRGTIDRKNKAIELSDQRRLNNISKQYQSSGVLPKNKPAKFVAYASSPNLEGIQKSIANFFAGEKKQLFALTKTPGLYSVHSKAKGELPVVVIQTKKGFYFGPKQS